MSAAAFERTLRLLRHSPSAYARGYRTGAGVAEPGDDSPPRAAPITSLDWRLGHEQARRDRLEYVSASPVADAHAEL